VIVLPFHCNLHLIHTFHFHLKYDYSVLKHISPVPLNYRGMKITGSSRHQEGCGALGHGVCAVSLEGQWGRDVEEKSKAEAGRESERMLGWVTGSREGKGSGPQRGMKSPSSRRSSMLVVKSHNFLAGRPPFISFISGS
jgi:hypothetical protein